MNDDDVAAVRNGYAVAERKDLEGWINLFTPDGVFVDNSVGVTYRGRALADPVRNYGTAFSNMHRELYRIYAYGNVVVVQLALQGTHDGPLQLPFGELPATGKQMDAPCCDVFELEDSKIKRFDCYPEGSIIFGQLGVLNNLDAALSIEVVAHSGISLRCLRAGQPGSSADIRSRVRAAIVCCGA